MKTIVHSPTSDLKRSQEFYHKLGYSNLTDQTPNIFTDGSAIIEINPDRFARAGVKIWQSDWNTSIQNLAKYTQIHAFDGGYLLTDLNGCWIYLIESPYPYDQISIAKNSAIPGNFAGLSLESANMDITLQIWQGLGFERLNSGPNDSYVTLADQNQFIVSIMKHNTCPHLFFNPSMTYFNGGQNVPIITKIRALDIEIAEEITYFNKDGEVDNIIIRDPGGYGFFIFND